MSRHDDDDDQRDAGGGADDAGILTDAELLRRFRAGDSDAFGLLWRTHRASALRFAKSLGAASPEDIVGEAVARTLKKIRDGGGPQDDFGYYLLVAVRNLVHARKTYRMETGYESDVDLPVVAPDDVEAEALGAMDANLIDVVFAAMPEREARLLRAVAKDGVPVGVAAKAEGMTSNHASVVLKRARKSFQKIWIQKHTTVQSGASAECRWVLEHAGVYLSGAMKAAPAARVKKHLAKCDACAVAIDDVRSASHSWGKALGGAAGLLPGGFATTAWGAPTAGPMLVGGAIVAATSVVAGLVLEADRSHDPEEPAPPAVSTTQTPTPSPSDSPLVITPPETPSSSVAPPPRPAPRPASASAPAPTTVAPLADLTAAADTGPNGLCYPALSGSGEPGQPLLVSGLGWQVRTVIDADGHWQTARLDNLTQGTVQYVVSYDGAGAPNSPLSASLTVTRPPILSAGLQTAGLRVTATGRPGQPVEILLDGQPLATATLSDTGTWQGVFPTPAPGNHQVAVRYAPTGCTGPSNAVSVTV